MIDASKEVSFKGHTKLTSSAEFPITTVEITHALQKAIAPSSTEQHQQPILQKQNLRSDMRLAVLESLLH